MDAGELPSLGDKGLARLLIVGGVMSLLLFSPRQCEASQETNPEVCLDLLQSMESLDFSGGLQLGRVFWDGEVMEPVLIRKNEEGYSFRNCSGGLPTEVAVDEADLELFKSALVAHFAQARTEALTTYREVEFLGYQPEGETELVFRGAGSMLEARRLDGDHVEVTATRSVRTTLAEGAPVAKVAVLLVTSRAAMGSMGPDVWEDGWGAMPEDSLIEREIIWWELAGAGDLRVHPAVGSFEELANLVARPVAGPGVEWDGALKGKLKPILDRAAFALVVTERPEHIELAAAILELANSTNSDVVFDVATLEAGSSKQHHVRQEGTASGGRYWLLTRLYDLAAIMPDRIAGKVRRRYYQSAIRLASTRAVEARFTKSYVTLATDSPVLQVANAVYQDQAAGMAKFMSFLGCLLEGTDEMVAGRIEVLEEGLELVEIPAEDLLDMDVGKAFQYLFQGFSLPAGLRAGERSFLASIIRGDPEVLRLVRLLQSAFATTSLDPHAACQVALISDDLLLGRPIGKAPVTVVASMPTPVLSIPATLNTTTEPSVIAAPVPRFDPLYDEARLAARKARIALARAIEAKGSRHTKKKIQKGNEQLDRGDALLKASEGIDIATLREAIRTFEEAEKNYRAAHQTSWKKERHGKPKLRVN